MQLDTENKFITEILKVYDLKGKTVLEIGCGTGRITQEIVRFASKVVAIDPDAKALTVAKQIKNANIDFLCIKGDELQEIQQSFDLVIYSLSLHHIPKKNMLKSLTQAAEKLKSDGKILVIEPGSTGSFMEAEREFSVGDCDEELQKKQAFEALSSLEGFTIEQHNLFSTKFSFESVTDFFSNIVPVSWQGDEQRLRRFLLQHKTDKSIELSALRELFLLGRS